jgi:predicted short-subunit dehydrogenase-like oxidoreductase (DUF2520 family)
MSKKIKIISIGAGNIAHHLIPALYNVAPCSIQQVYSRTLKNAAHLAHKVDAQAISKLDHIGSDADLYLIMVPDDDIKSVVDALPELEDSQILAHTSGATPSNTLKAISKNYGAFYPLQTFKKNIPVSIEHTPFLIYGNNSNTTRYLRSLARKISSKVSECNDKERLTYHLAAVFVNNFTNHMACVARRLLESEKLEVSVLQAIVETTCHRMINGDPCISQTGPAIREDIALQNRHLKLLETNPEWQALYQSVSQSIKTMYHENSK